jgi:D-alanyl-D-alanine carboxypeptidase (penicillin-binding protein 5/6)
MGERPVGAPRFGGRRLRRAVAAVGVAGGLVISVPRGTGDSLRTTLQRTDPLVAPLTAGQRVGSLQIDTAGGTRLATVPLVVLEPVPLAGIFGRAWDAIRLWIQ